MREQASHCALVPSQKKGCEVVGTISPSAAAVPINHAVLPSGAVEILEVQPFIVIDPIPTQSHQNNPKMQAAALEQE